MMTGTNPYNYNLPLGPEMFFGRQDDVETLTRGLTATPGDSYALIGGRRMGKSSLLEALVRALETAPSASTQGLLSLPIFLDLTGEGINSAVDFFRVIGKRAQLALASWVAFENSTGNDTGEIASLSKRQANLERNLQTLEEKRTEFLDPRSVPPDIESAIGRTRKELDDVRACLKELESRSSRRLSDKIPGALTVDGTGIGNHQPPAPAFAQVLQEWGRATMAQRGGRLRLVLLLDECEQIVEQPWASELYGALRYLLVGQSTQSLLKVVMTGSHRFLTQVRQQGSPLRNVLVYHRLGVLSEDATCDLVNRPTGNVLPLEVVRTTLDQCGGHPFLCQYIMWHLWERGLKAANPEMINQLASEFPHERNDFTDWLNGLGEFGSKVYSRHYSDLNAQGFIMPWSEIQPEVV